jgi:hypothetical protein
VDVRGLRIYTNVKKCTGKEAINTTLGPAHQRNYRFIILAQADRGSWDVKKN